MTNEQLADLEKRLETVETLLKKITKAEDLRTLLDELQEALADGRAVAAEFRQNIADANKLSDDAGGPYGTIS